MKLHMATEVKMKNKKREKALQVCNEASEVLKYLFDGTKPRSLFSSYLPTQTQPHAQILVKMSCSYAPASLFSTN